MYYQSNCPFVPNLTNFFSLMSVFFSPILLFPSMLNVKMSLILYCYGFFPHCPCLFPTCRCSVLTIPLLVAMSQLLHFFPCWPFFSCYLLISAPFPFHSFSLPQSELCLFFPKLSQWCIYSSSLVFRVTSLE